MTGRPSPATISDERARREAVGALRVQAARFEQRARAAYAKGQHRECLRLRGHAMQMRGSALVLDAETQDA